MKNKFKIVISFSIILILVSTFILCSKAPSEKNNKKYRIGIIPKSSDNTFWNVVAAGALDAGKEFNIDIIVKSPLKEENIDEQILLIEEAIENKVDALVLAACDFNKIAKSVDKAVDAGIPVVIVDSNVNSPKVSSFIGTNNYEAANLAAKRFAELIGGKGKVVIVSFVKDTTTAKEREEGVLEILNQNLDIEIVDTVYSLSNESIAEKSMEELLKQQSDIDGIIALNGPSATGAARTVAKLGLSGKIKVVGFDNTEEEIDYLEEGAIQATIIQNPYNMGYLGVKYAYNILNGVNVPKVEYTEATLVDKENMYLPKNQKLLFPFVK